MSKEEITKLTKEFKGLEEERENLVCKMNNLIPERRSESGVHFVANGSEHLSKEYKDYYKRIKELRDWHLAEDNKTTIWTGKIPEMELKIAELTGGEPQ